MNDYDDSQSNKWYDDESEAENETEGYPIDNYEITATPNDFNIITIFNFIESGSIKIPGFQRNYVWDIKRASKLIESLIIGLPVPQIFLYEEARNKFLVIDGQQRLMSIYYFIKQRFPREQKRAELRTIFEKEGKIPENIFNNDDYFAKFNLHLPEQVPGQKNKFNKLNYNTLSDYKTSFELRTIRNVIVKQLSPQDDDSAIYEIFNRLNSGGINLKPQEIRMSLYHSEFLEMLARINNVKKWRELVGVGNADIHMKDIEFILRGFAMLINGDNYVAPMTKFLNSFARKTNKFKKDNIDYFENLFTSFLGSCNSLSRNDFVISANRFSITIFESIFAGTCSSFFKNQSTITGKIDNSSVQELRKKEEFKKSITGKTTNTKLVKQRLSIAKSAIKIV